jgi:hypothetical protein
VVIRVSYQQEQSPGTPREALGGRSGDTGGFDVERATEGRNDEVILVAGADSAGISASERVDSGAIMVIVETSLEGPAKDGMKRSERK